MPMSSQLAGQHLAQRFCMPGSLGIADLVSLSHDLHQEQALDLPDTLAAHECQSANKHGDRTGPGIADLADAAGMLASLPDRLGPLQLPSLQPENSVPQLIRQVMHAATMHPSSTCQGRGCSHTQLQLPQTSKPAGQPICSDSSVPLCDGLADSHQTLDSQEAPAQCTRIGRSAGQQAGAADMASLRGSGFVGELLGRLCLRGHAAGIATALWQLTFNQDSSASVPGPIADSLTEVWLTLQQLQAAVAAVGHGVALERLLVALLAACNWPGTDEDKQHGHALLQLVLAVWHRSETR